MEDLERLVRVHGHHGLGDGPEVPIDELAQPPVVVEGSRSRSTGHEQLEPRGAEGVLDVDEQQADARAVARRRLESVLARPRGRLAKA